MGKRNGEVLAIPHPVPDGSWKLNEDMANRSVTVSTFSDSYQDPLRKQKLVPYHPNASRSRNAVRFPNESEPGRRFCQPRNEITYKCGVTLPNVTALPKVATQTWLILTNAVRSVS